MEDLPSFSALLSEPFFWAGCAIFAALGYALVEFIDEKLLEDVRPQDEEASGVGTLTLVSGFFGIVISVLIGLGVILSGNVDLIFVKQNEAMQAIIVGALETVWMIPYLYALNRGGAINAAPLFQAIPISAFLMGLLFFGEIPAKEHIIGSGVIITGSLLLNLKKGTFTLDKVTVGLMLLACLIISLGYLLFKETALEGNFTGSLFWSGVGMTLMSVLIWCGYKPYRDQFNGFVRSANKRAMLWQITNEGLNAFAVTASHLANVGAPSVMVATALNAFHPFFTLVIGWILGKKGSQKHAETLGGNEFYKKTIAISLIIIGTITVVI